MIFSEYMLNCKHRQEPEIIRRPVNGLNIEIGQPLSRCLLKPPHPHGSNLLWWMSGGSLLDYGVCCRNDCTEMKEAENELP